MFPISCWCVLFFVCASADGNLLHPLSDAYIDEINEKATTWVAGRNFGMSDWAWVQQLVNGSRKSHPAKLALYPHNVHDETEDVPVEFESADAWPKCDSIRQIRDQSRCGSCWAFGAVEAMSDRICIHSNQERQVYVSALDLLSCCWLCGMGCSGGEPLEAWSYWKRHGIATGGLFNRTDQGCKPYFLPECEDHPHNCENYVKTPKCTSKCANPSLNYKQSLTFGKDVQTFGGEKQIMLEIYKNGPVESAFTVMDDFINYKSGIYQPTSRRALGGHAIKIVAWGVENGTKFWKIANSWNERWGENGYFRIIRGVNSCGIEDQAVAGTPILNNTFYEATVEQLVYSNDKLL